MGRKEAMMAADAELTSMGELSDLEPLSKRLKAAQDQLNKSLQTIQDRLNALAIGVEVWVDDPIEETDWSEVLDRNNEPSGEREFLITELGYGRRGDAWALLVRTRRIVAPNGGSEIDWQYLDNSAPRPLLNASRNVRAGAVRLIPRLIDALKEQAQAIIGIVEDAKKIADSLN
jgi:hypothetical protein